MIARPTSTLLRLSLSASVFVACQPGTPNSDEAPAESESNEHTAPAEPTPDDTRPHVLPRHEAPLDEDEAITFLSTLFQPAVDPSPLPTAINVAPECRLSYQWVLEVNSETTSGPMAGLVPQTRWIGEGELHLQPIDEGYRIDSPFVQMTSEMGGVPRPFVPGAAQPFIELRIEGNTLREISGPTPLFSAHMFFPGLTALFPGVAEDPNASAWHNEIVYFPNIAGMATLHHRDDPSEAAHDPSSAQIVPVANRVSAHFMDAGTPVVLSERVWSHDQVLSRDSRGRETGSHREAKGWAAYRPDGHVLWSTYSESRSDEVGPPGNTSIQQSEVLAEVRLVSSCGGPTMPRFPRVGGTPESRSIALAGRVRTALGVRDFITLFELLDAPIPEAHSDPELLAHIHRALEELGSEAFGAPIRADEAVPMGERFVVYSAGTTNLGPDQNVELFSRYELRMAESAATLVSLELSTFDYREDPEEAQEYVVFELSADSLVFEPAHMSGSGLDSNR